MAPPNITLTLSTAMLEAAILDMPQEAVVAAVRALPDWHIWELVGESSELRQALLVAACSGLQDAPSSPDAPAPRSGLATWPPSRPDPLDAEALELPVQDIPRPGARAATGAMATAIEHHLRAAPSGLASSELATKLGKATSTMSYHLKRMAPQGRAHMTGAGRTARWHHGPYVGSGGGQRWGEPID